MNKADVPRLRKFLGILMRCEYSELPGKDMVTMVRDMEWLAQYADKLDKAEEGIKVLGTSPIDDSKVKNKKR